MATIEIPQDKKLGSNNGDCVLFAGELQNRFPGMYGLITGYNPARNYTQDAKYFVDVFNGEEYITSIVAEWGSITDRN